MLTYLRTSILDSPAQTITNTVNTVGVMGKGLASAMRERFPDMFAAYKRICDAHQFDVGQLWLWKSPTQWVLNFPTKKHWRNPSKLEWIEAGLQKFVAEYDRRGIHEISFPRLGCGNGGLDWKEVQPLMERYLAPLPITIYIHDFERDIGVPEHTAVRQMLDTVELGSFAKFMDDLRTVATLNDGQFRTVTNQSEFKAEVLLDDTLVIDRSGARRLISKDDLAEFWSTFSRGLVTRLRLGGSTRENAYYLFSIVGQLPYAKVVEIQPKDGSTALALMLQRPSESKQVRAESQQARTDRLAV